MGVGEFIALLEKIGVPSIFVMTLWCIKCCIRYTKQLKVLLNAVQAQMRNQLLEQYNKHMAVGWISTDDMDEWEHQYQAYHSLGANGVLDARRNTLLALPNIPPQDGNTTTVTQLGN